MKLLYIVLAVPLQIAVGILVAGGFLFIGGLVFGHIAGAIAAAAIAAFVIIDTITFILYEGFGVDLIPWWTRTAKWRSNWPAPAKVAGVLAIYAVLGFLIYKGISSGSVDVNHPNRSPILSKLPSDHMRLSS